METNLDLLRSVEPPDQWWQGPVRPFAWIAALLAAAALLLLVTRTADLGRAANTGTVAYCVTESGSPAQPKLRTALFTADDQGLKVVASGVTGGNGCGTFAYVPAGKGYYVSAWSADGEQIVDSPWFAAGKTTIAPTVRLDPPGAVGRLAFH